MAMAPHDNVTTWRDLADQLTPEQVARFDRLEQLCRTDVHKVFPNEDHDQVVADILDTMLDGARHDAASNLIDSHQFGHVPMPPAVESAEHWEQDEDTGAWTRRLAVSTRSVEGAADDATVFVDGVQSADGSVVWSLYALAGDCEPLTVEQGRQYAAMITEAADKVDALTGESRAPAGLLQALLNQVNATYSALKLTRADDGLLAARDAVADALKAITR